MANYYGNCVHEINNKHGYQSDGLFNDSIAFMLANYGVPSTAWEMLCKILHRGTVNWIVVIQQLLKKYEAKKYCYSCLDCTHKVFDRGKEFRVIEFWWVFMCARGRVIDRGKWFELSWITSYYVSISSKISVGMPTSVVVVLNRLMLLLKTYTYFVYQLIIKLGYGLELVFETWNAFFLVKSGNILDACKLFEKIWQHITILWTNVILTKRKIGFGNAHELSAQLFARDVRLARQINEAGVGFMEMGIPLEGSARLLTLKPIFLIESSILIFFFVFEFNLFFYGLWSMGNVCAYPLDFMEQEIISVNNTMLIVWMLNFLELNLWVFLSEIKLFILFLLNGYEKKMHDSVVWSLSKDADFLLLGFSNGLPTGIKLLHVSSMKTNINTGEKSDVSKILVLSLGGNIGFLSQKTVVTVCDEFSTGRPRSILQWVMLFTASNVPAGKLFSRKWLGVLTSEDHVGLHDYSLMVTMLVIRSYCLLLGVSFFLPSLIHAFTMNDNHNTQKKFMKETIFPGLLVFNTLEDTRKIVWFNMGYRGMECYERRREIKRMLAKASAGAISGHEWVEEMLMRVNCCCTQPGVAVSKLTVMLTQTCSLLEDNGVVCGVLLSVNISENNIQLNEIVHDITKAISIVVLIGPDFFSSILKSRWEFEIGSWELSLHIALSTPDSAKSRITEAIMHSFKWVSPLLVMALHSLMIYSFCIQEYTILRRLWHEIFTILATSLRVSTSHHCCTAGPREEMNISISHNGMVGCFLVKILSASYKSEYGELVLKPKSSSVQLIGTNMELAYYTISEIEVVTAKRKGYCASQDILILVELLFHGVFEGSIVLTQVLTAPALQDGLCEYSTFLYTTNRIYADSGTCLLHYSSRCYATFSRLRSATFEYERGQSLLRFAEKVLPHSLLWARSFPTFILEVEC